MKNINELPTFSVLFNLFFVPTIPGDCLFLSFGKFIRLTTCIHRPVIIYPQLTGNRNADPRDANDRNDLHDFGDTNDANDANDLQGSSSITASREESRSKYAPAIRTGNIFFHASVGQKVFMPWNQAPGSDALKTVRLHSANQSAIILVWTSF